MIIVRLLRHNNYKKSLPGGVSDFEYKENGAGRIERVEVSEIIS
ncbi:hypothetical protein [Gramella sp. KN1008]|nr:hypothetical protein [Gramella sp. KN1008]